MSETTPRLESALLCPRCSDNYLHHVEVICAFRDTEDGGPGNITKSRCGETVVLRSTAIPGRRDVLTVEFCCESCEARPVLGIWQHKGQTFVEWQGGTDVRFEKI